MSHYLQQLASCNEISWASYYFADFIARHSQVELDHPVALSAALVSEAHRNGDVGVDLAQFIGQSYFKSNQVDVSRMPQFSNIEAWRQVLLDSHCIAVPGTRAPLTLEGARLYLNRYWHYEQTVANKILALLETEHASDQTITFDDQMIDASQQAAIKNSIKKGFSVISGGPGSGKTSTVIRILIQLLELNPDSRIALAAPTGKAAARMMDSIHAQIEQTMHNLSILEKIPTQATTIHRLLDYRHQNYQFNTSRQLPLDCIVVDEASMIDLSLMYHLLNALSSHTRLILLGDRDQLSAVAAGNVLGDITGHGTENQLSSSADDNKISAAITLLQRSYRFDPSSAIGQLAQAVNRGDLKTAMHLLQAQQGGLTWISSNTEKVDTEALANLVLAYQKVITAGSPEAALQAFSVTRLLCATNRGPMGIEHLNRQISAILQGPDHHPENELYHGLPIMIQQNHYALQLFNGDVGILWQGKNGLEACFNANDETTRRIAINRLPEFLPAWASTVHKAQGSEFDAVLLVLPTDPDSGALSRELIYTAITRARKQFSLHASHSVINRAISKITQRRSALTQKLGWPDATNF